MLVLNNNYFFNDINILKYSYMFCYCNALTYNRTVNSHYYCYYYF